MISIQLGSAFTQTTITIHNGDETVTIALEHGGNGPPLLLLHGYPQTHIMWHKLAPRLANHYHVICPDLRGYGDSSKPLSTPDYLTYSKKVMAQDIMQVMATLGYSHFFAAGHDRGARVLHRLARDYPHALNKLCLMDIAPTLHMFQTVDQTFATSYYHWFFLIQPGGLPERMIATDPEYYLYEKLQRWSKPGSAFSTKFNEVVVAEYMRYFQMADTLRATCDDYRAAASIDLEHDNQDQDRKIICPLLILWGQYGFIEKNYDVLNIWKQHATRNTLVIGKALDCGHFLPEETPDDVYNALHKFFTTG